MCKIDAYMHYFRLLYTVSLAMHMQGVIKNCSEKVQDYTGGFEPVLLSKG